MANAGAFVRTQAGRATHLQFADHVLDGNDSPLPSPKVPLFVRPWKL